MKQEKELLLFETGGIRCALPLNSVLKVESAAAISSLPNALNVVAGIINVHGKLLPVMDVRQRLGMPFREMALDDHLILVQTVQREMVLWVGQVFGVEACDCVPQKDAQSILGQMPYVKGVTAVADDMILICDLEHFLSEDEEH